MTTYEVTAEGGVLGDVLARRIYNGITDDEGSYWLNAATFDRESTNAALAAIDEGWAETVEVLNATGGFAGCALDESVGQAPAAERPFFSNLLDSPATHSMSRRDYQDQRGNLDDSPATQSMSRRDYQDQRGTLDERRQRVNKGLSRLQSYCLAEFPRWLDGYVWPGMLGSPRGPAASRWQLACFVVVRRVLRAACAALDGEPLDATRDVDPEYVGWPMPGEKLERLTGRYAPELGTWMPVALDETRRCRDLLSAAGAGKTARSVKLRRSAREHAWNARQIVARRGAAFLPTQTQEFASCVELRMLGEVLLSLRTKLDAGPASPASRLPQRWKHTQGALHRAELATELALGIERVIQQRRGRFAMKEGRPGADGSPAPGTKSERRGR